MNFQLVLFSGLGFLVFTGFCLFLLSKANNSELTERSKKLLMLVTVLTITMFGIFVFDLYTADHIARYSMSTSD